jgi:hypothetical protein
MRPRWSQAHKYTLEVYNMTEYLQEAMENDFSHYDRDRLVAKYGFAIPDETAIDVLSKYSPIVEMGCGIAYWAHLLQEAGCTVMPFDICWSDNIWGFEQTWTTVYTGTPDILDKFSKNTTLLLSWPPYWNEMAYESLKNFKGDYVVYIGESKHGCTATNKFFNTLFREWECIDVHYIPTWEGVHDDMSIWKRRA